MGKWRTSTHWSAADKDQPKTGSTSRRLIRSTAAPRRPGAAPRTARSAIIQKVTNNQTSRRPFLLAGKTQRWKTALQCQRGSRGVPMNQIRPPDGTKRPNRPCGWSRFKVVGLLTAQAAKKEVNQHSSPSTGPPEMVASESTAIDPAAGIARQTAPSQRHKKTFGRAKVRPPLLRLLTRHINDGVHFLRHKTVDQNTATLPSSFRAFRR